MTPSTPLRKTHPSRTETRALWTWSELAHPDFVTQVYAYLGRRGSGKTYGAGVLAEDMLDEGAQVIVFDPVGTWWGLRAGAAGGEHLRTYAGFDIPVLGGDHGDLALVPDAGAVVARMLVETGSSAVLDMKNMRKAERKRFAMEWAEEFFHQKAKHHGACHVFLEEAHTVLPQKTMHGEERMVGAFEDLVRLGRNYGIGVTMIDQRPQSVSKDALNQAECLAVFQLVGPQERDAIKRWTEQKEALAEVGALSSLAQGECFLWSPQWLGTMERVRFRPKRTFDASATPKAGKAKAAPEIKALDLAVLEQAMAEVVEKVKDADPKLLKKRIAELEAQVRMRSMTNVEVDTRYRRELEGRLNEALKLRDAYLSERNHCAGELGALVAKIADLAKHAHVPQLTLATKDPYRFKFAPPPEEEDDEESCVGMSLEQNKAGRRRRGDDGYGAGESRTLDTLAAMGSLTVKQLATLSGIADRTARNHLVELRKRELVETSGNLVTITVHGQADAACRTSRLLKSSAEVRQRWLEQLDPQPAAILRYLIDIYPSASSVHALAQIRTLAERTVRNQLVVLRSRGLIEKGHKIKAHPDLFREPERR